MTITLPDDPALADLAPEEALLELACALYARGRLGKVAAAKMAGMDFFAFQGALKDRGLGGYKEEFFNDDLLSIRKLFEE